MVCRRSASNTTSHIRLGGKTAFLARSVTTKSAISIGTTSEEQCKTYLECRRRLCRLFHCTYHPDGERTMCTIWGFRDLSETISARAFYRYDIFHMRLYAPKPRIIRKHYLGKRGRIVCIVWIWALTCRQREPEFLHELITNMWTYVLPTKTRVLAIPTYCPRSVAEIARQCEIAVVNRQTRFVCPKRRRLHHIGAITSKCLDLPRCRRFVCTGFDGFAEIWIYAVVPNRDIAAVGSGDCKVRNIQRKPGRNTPSMCALQRFHAGIRKR